MPVELHEPKRAASFHGHLKVNPRYRQALARRGLTSPQSILDLPGDVISGHRDRHVVDVRVNGLRAILKKEHRVSLSTRLRNWFAGFGAVSDSEREAQVIQELAAPGVPVPKWLAFGEDGRGRAFVLLRRVNETRKLSRASPELALAVADAVARVHHARFDAPDLTCKHVLVARDGSVTLIDWPRAKRQARIDRVRALARLLATLPSEFANTSALLCFLKHYRRHSGVRVSARDVMLAAAPLTKRRSVGEQRLGLRPAPRIRWLDGEALCVTNEYHRSAGDLIRFAPAGLATRCVAWLTRRPIQSPAIRLAGLLIRMWRHRVPVAPVLAFGGRPNGSGFLITKQTDLGRPLRDWLSAPRPKRALVLRRLGRLLRRCHDAGTGRVALPALHIRDDLRLRLAVDRRQGKLRITRSTVVREVVRLCGALGLMTRSDVAQVVHGYGGDAQLSADVLRGWGGPA